MVTGWLKAALFLASYTCLVTAQTTAEFSGSGLNPAGEPSIGFEIGLLSKHKCMHSE